MSFLHFFSYLFYLFSCPSFLFAFHCLFDNMYVFLTICMCCCFIIHMWSVKNGVCNCLCSMFNIYCYDVLEEEVAVCLRYSLPLRKSSYSSWLDYCSDLKRGQKCNWITGWLYFIHFSTQKILFGLMLPFSFLSCYPSSFFCLNKHCQKSWSLIFRFGRQI